MDIDKLKDQRPKGKPCSLMDAALPTFMQVLVLAPHPDDFDAIGVTLRELFLKGHPLFAAVIRTGSGVDDADLHGSTAEKSRLREQEQRRSLQFFGLPGESLQFLSLVTGPDDQVVDCPDNREAIGTLLMERKPDVVFLPHGNDTNSAHRAVYAMLSNAALEIRHPLVAFLNRDAKTLAMRTDLYTPFGEAEAKWKQTLLRFHDSQQRRNLRTRHHGFDDRVLNLNRTIARELEIPHEFAEAFEIIPLNNPSFILLDPLLYHVK